MISPADLQNRAVNGSPRSLLPADVRQTIVDHLAAALADAWRCRHANDDEQDRAPEHPEAA